MNLKTSGHVMLALLVVSVIAVGGVAGQIPAPNAQIGIDLVDQDGNAIEKQAVVEAQTPGGEQLAIDVSDANGEVTLDVPPREDSDQVEIVVAGTVVKTIPFQSGPQGETVQVASGTLDASVSVEITELPTTVEAGESVPVSVRVENDDLTDATATLELQDVDTGEVLTSETVSVPVGDEGDGFVGVTTTNLTWSDTASESGDFVIRVVASGGAKSQKEIVTVEATEDEEDDGDEDNQDDGSDDESGGSNGGSGGTGGGGGTGESSDGDTGEQTTTVQDVRDTLGLLDQPTTTTAIEETTSDEAGTTVTVATSETESVQSVAFDSATTGSVGIQDYGEPPKKVAEQIRESIAADVEGISGTTASESENEDTEQVASTMNIVSVVDIKPTNESAQDSSATVTFQVDRGRVTNPERLTVFKEEYVFETQTEQWVQVETTVTETTEQHVTLTADVSSFSLFAVTELDEQIDTNGLNQSATNQTETNETETPASTDDGIPGFGVVVAVIAVLAAATVARQRVN